MPVGSVGITAILAGLAVVLSAVTYIRNRRRTNEPSLSSHNVSLRGRMSHEERRGPRANKNNGDVSRDSFAGAGGGGRNTVAAAPKSYYAVRAERHVSQYSASIVEWRDDVMGVRIPFSPILFAVETEGRQAPLVLIALRYLRQPEHRVTVIIEACASAVTAEEYRDSSLSRVRDCVKLLACNTTRIGVTSHPCAEYCYVDGDNRLRYALSIFLVHERLAVTAQYVADTRVKGVLPTAFNELVRSIQFSPPRPSASYLLCAEPRLGLGFRLPLDFAMVCQLHDALAVPDEFSTAGCWGGSEKSSRVNSRSQNGSSLGATVPSLNGPLWGTQSSWHLPEVNPDGVGESNCSTPFATVAGRGLQRMLVVACYEPLPRRRVSWQQLFERLIHTTLVRFSAVQSGGESGVITVAWCEEEQSLPQGKHDKSSTFVVRPQRLVVPVNGDSAVDDDAGNTLQLDGAFCVQKVLLDARGACVAFLRDVSSFHHHQEEEEKEEDVSRTGRVANSLAKQDRESEDAGTISAYLSVFCLATRDQCVSISFLSSTTQHTLEEFITFCRRTIDTVSVGNHFGQSPSLIYCNRQHEVLPFHILLDSASAVAGSVVRVEEPMIGDPLAIFHVDGLEDVQVLLRVFPCPSASCASLPLQRRAIERLEKVVRTYLTQLPDRVCLHHWEVTMLGSRAALEIHYEQLVDNDGGSDAECLDLDEEVGHINPFARYCEIPPSLSSAFAGKEGAGEETTGPTLSLAKNTSAAGALALAPMCSAESLLRRSPSRDSREEVASMHVAVVVCCEGCAFLFLGVCTDCSLGAVRQVVRHLAAKMSVFTGIPA